MTKTEARKTFQSDVDAISTTVTEKISSFLSDEQIGRFVEQFVVWFETYCEKIVEMQQSGKKNAVGYIHFSWLRTNFLAENYKYRVDAYDENWYLDRVECSDECDVSAVFSYLDEFANEVDIARKKYVYSLSVADVKQIVLEESMKYNLIMTALIQTGLKLALESPGYQKVLCAEKFGIYIGEFQDACFPLYQSEAAQSEVVD